MKHLHLRFILASLAGGFGVFFVVSATWAVHDLPLGGWTPIRTTLAAVIAALTGAVLMVFAWQGIRREMYGPTKKRKT